MGSGRTKEALVVCLKRGLDEKKGTIRVVQRASPRVCVVAGPEEEVDRLKATPGTYVIGAGTNPEIIEKLNPSESLFVRGWMINKTSQKRRRGDGLSWDAPGFEAPDSV